MMNIEKMTSGIIPLEELPLWSPWPARLLQLTEWQTLTRNVARVDREYDKDKYLKCAQFLAEHPGATSDDVRAFEQYIPTPSICVSRKNVLYELPCAQIIPADNALLLDVLEPYIGTADTIVELGCGYGYNLWELRRHFPEKTFLGGEYSANAVALAATLYKDAPNLTVESFNYYDNAYSLIERSQGKVLVFTRHSIEQLPSAKNVIDVLSNYFDRITTVVHMDVAQENYGDSLLDLLRKRYVAINDYNRDLVGLLRERTDIELLRNDTDEYGQNPLNPTSVLVWRPRQGPR